MLELGHEYKTLGFATAALTPIKTDWPRFKAAGFDFITDDRAALMERIRDPRARKVKIFVDEVARTIGKFDRDAEVFCAEVRHAGGGGHQLHLAGQRPTMLNVTIREQCTGLFMFRLPLMDCKRMAETFGQPGLIAGTALLPREYFHCTNKMGSLVKKSLTWKG